jgi:hypothetical protein
VADAHAPVLTAEREAVLDSSPSSTAIFTLLAVAIAIALCILYALWEFWPTQAILQAKSTPAVHLFGITKHVSIEIRLFVIVALSGALGGLLHATRSFAWYVGHSSLKWRWFPYYIGMLLTGAGIATVVYVVVRGGIVSGRATTADVNPYGFAAIGAIVGLFSEQALEMLRRVANDFFAEPPAGNDQAKDPDVSTATTTEITTTATTATTTTSASGDAAAAAPAVEVLDAELVSSTTATLTGRVSTNGAKTTAKFDYGPSTDYGTSTADEPLDGPDPVDVSVDIDNLSPGTEYHFRLVATNSVGQTEGSDVTFTTAS